MNKETEKIELTEEKFKELTDKAVEGQIKEFKTELVDVVKEEAEKLFEAHEKAIQRTNPAKADEVQEDELTVSFFKALASNNKAEIAEAQKSFVEFEGKSHQINKVADDELNIGTDEQGGYYVPKPILARILTTAENYGLARRFGLVIPMTSDTLDVPRVDTEAEFTPIIAEKGPYNALNYEFGNTRLNAGRYGGMVRPTEEFIADANVDVLNLLFTLFGRAQARTEDRLFFEAILADADVTGLSMGTGDDAFTDVILDDFLLMQDQVNEGADEGARYVMHKSIVNFAKRIKVDTSSDNRYVFGMPGGDSPRTLWDAPYHTNGVMPSLADSDAETPFVIYGNLQNYILGDRQQMTMRVLDQLYAANGEVGVRVSSRIAAGGAIPSDLVVLSTAAEVT
jgi:HK97 family phage major capsid protein